MKLEYKPDQLDSLVKEKLKMKISIWSMKHNDVPCPRKMAQYLYNLKYIPLRNQWKKRCGFQHDIPTEFNLVCTCLNTLGFLPEPVVNLINFHLHVSLIIVYNELITCRLSSFVRSHGRATLQLIELCSWNLVHFFTLIYFCGDTRTTEIEFALHLLNIMAYQLELKGGQGEGQVPKPRNRTQQREKLGIQTICLEMMLQAQFSG